MASSLSDKAIFIYDTFFSANITQGQLDTQIKESSFFRLAFEEVISYPNLLDKMKLHDRYDELIGLGTEAYSMILSNITRDENAQLEANAFQFMSNPSNDAAAFADFLLTVSGHIGFGNIINNPKTSADLAQNQNAVDLVLSSESAIKALLNSPNGLNAFGGENLSALKIFQNASVFSKLRASLRFEQNDVLDIPSNTSLYYGPKLVGEKYFYLQQNEPDFYMSDDMYNWEKVTMPNDSTGNTWVMSAYHFHSDKIGYDKLNKAYFFISERNYAKPKWTKNFVQFYDVSLLLGNSYIRSFGSWKGKIWFFNYSTAGTWDLYYFVMKAGETNYAGIKNTSQPAVQRLHAKAPSDDHKYMYWDSNNYHFTFMDENGDFDANNQAGQYFYNMSDSNNYTYRSITFNNGYYFLVYGTGTQMGISKIDLLANNDSLFTRPYSGANDRYIDTNQNKVSYWMSDNTNDYHQVSYANGVYIIPITGGYATSLNGVTWDEQLFDVTYTFNIKGADSRGFYGNIPGSTYMLTSYDSSQTVSLDATTTTTTTAAVSSTNNPEGVSAFECLIDSTDASIVEYNGTKMVFNNKDYYENTNYVLTTGSYKILNVPENYPIAVLNKGKEDHITYTGSRLKTHYHKTSGTDADGVYDFFYGDVTIKVASNFESVSLYYYKNPNNHGYLGMEKILVSQDYLDSVGTTASDNTTKVSDITKNTALVKNFNCVGNEALEQTDLVNVVYTTTTTTQVPTYTKIVSPSTTTTTTAASLGDESFSTGIALTSGNEYAIDTNASNLLTIDGTTFDSVATSNSRHVLGTGVYIFNVTADEPVAFEGATMSTFFGPQHSNISYSGDFYKRSIKSINNIPYYFYHGQIVLIVDSPFSTINLVAFNNAATVASNAFSWDRSTTTTTTTASVTTTTTDPLITYTRCIDASPQVTNVGGKYLFDSVPYESNSKVGLNLGVYVLKNVPEAHPIAFLNYGKWSQISYTGNALKSKTHIAADGHQYQYYYGDVTVTVNGNFGLISYDCLYHGYMGGENKTIFSSNCPTFVQSTTTAAPTTTTTTTGVPNSIAAQTTTTTTTTAAPTTTTTTTTASGPVTPDYCLITGSAGNTYANTGGNYIFNGNLGSYGMKTGTYIFKNVSASHPIAFLNYGKTNTVTYSGQYSQGAKQASDGYQYSYYYGDVTVTVTGDFNLLSYECYYHGYMGGENNIIFDNTNCT